MARVLPLLGWNAIYSDNLSVIFSRPQSDAATPEKFSRGDSTLGIMDVIRHWQRARSES